jgi:hypothetical protein
MYGETLDCGNLSVTNWVLQIPELFLDGDRVRVARSIRHEPMQYSAFTPVYPAPVVQPINQQRLPNNKNYKISMCRSIRENRYCPFGNRCEFAHGEDELRRYRHIAHMRRIHDRGQFIS